MNFSTMLIIAVILLIFYAVFSLCRAFVFGFFRLIYSIFFSKSEPSPALIKGIQFPNLGPIDGYEVYYINIEELTLYRIGDAYEELLPELSKYISYPAKVTETLNDVPNYKVRCDGQEYIIYTKNDNRTEEAYFGHTVYAFFHIINKQLGNASVKFYAIRRGNELAAVFLTPEKLEAAQSAFSQKRDWPYIPEDVDWDYWEEED